MIEPKLKTTQESSDIELQEAITKSSAHLAPIITDFSSFDKAPENIQIYIQLLVIAVFKKTGDKKDKFEVFNKKDLKFNLAGITEVFQKSLKNCDAQQTSEAHIILNRFVTYVSGELAWHSKTNTSDGIVLPKIKPVIKEKQMFNLGQAQYYHQAIALGISQMGTLNNEDLVGLLCLSTLFDSKRLHKNYLECIVHATQDQLAQLTPSDIHIEIKHTNMPEQSFKLHLNTLSILLEKLRRKDIQNQNDPIRLHKAIKGFVQKFVNNQPQSMAELELPFNLKQILEVAESEYFLNRPAFFHAAMTKNKNLQPTSLLLETKCRILKGRAFHRFKKQHSNDIQSTENNSDSSSSESF